MNKNNKHHIVLKMLLIYYMIAWETVCSLVFSIKVNVFQSEHILKQQIMISQNISLNKNGRM